MKETELNKSIQFLENMDIDFLKYYNNLSTYQKIMFMEIFNSNIDVEKTMLICK